MVGLSEIPDSWGSTVVIRLKEVNIAPLLSAIRGGGTIAVLHWKICKFALYTLSDVDCHAQPAERYKFSGELNLCVQNGRALHSEAYFEFACLNSRLAS
ncbi:hypothetical protein AVEN_220211-1 [Araneus ventricosus]|uniref:Uncharacterized protein n=1 Tax=Araneus ventricosus TaxID=182803 RepID=A0A4Y2GYQ4_ARAVE|nr:hypothetical protein AVEN_220211-1 [Araneus ventricosus]